MHRYFSKIFQSFKFKFSMRNVRKPQTRYIDDSSSGVYKITVLTEAVFQKSTSSEEP